MTTKQSEREEFLCVLTRECGDDRKALDIGRAIMRDAATVQRLAELACNRPLTEAESKREGEACKRLSERAKELGCSLRLDTDPRGYCVKLLLPSRRYNTWGGEAEGWGVPA